MFINKNQISIVATLSLGTFLEYFDLMLYVHMGVLLNELFFPTNNIWEAHLISSIGFCSVFFLRPLGALILGKIGDSHGRKTVIVFATIMTAMSCIIIAILPIYDQIGIFATICLTLCRIVQGVSSMGESIGAEIYITETISPPAQYPAVAFVTIAAALGGLASLMVGYCIISFGFNWRFAFLIGACIAIAGSIIRFRFKETAEFLSRKNLSIQNDHESTRNNFLTAFALFFIQCAYPACFYLVYVYFGDVLKNEYGYNALQVIEQNLKVSVVQIIGFVLLAMMSYFINPMKIVFYRLYVFCIFIPVLPYLLSITNSTSGILIVQYLIVLLWLGDTPATPIFLKHFSTLKRFTYAGVSFAFSRAFMYIATSLSFGYLIYNFGYYVLLLVMMPFTMAFAAGLYYFDSIEKSSYDCK